MSILSLSRTRALKSFLAMTLVLGFLCLWFGTGCVNVPLTEPYPGTVCRWDFTSSADGARIPCSIYLPNGFSPDKSYPVWVELHALFSRPIVENDPNNPFSNDMKKVADEKGWIIVAPWGRNLHSLYMDGMENAAEPNLFDDFAAGAAGWQPSGGAWSAAGGVYRQTDASASWKESVLSGSTGKDYSVRFRFKDISAPGTETAVGANLRRGSSGDLYHADLYRDSAGTRSVRVFKASGGSWQELFRYQYNWSPLNPAIDPWIDVKFSCYQDYLEVYVNEETINLQPAYDSQAYSYGRKVPGAPLPAGEMSLCCYGGAFEFDEVRVQNEYEYGERDVVDCVLGAMEKYRIDPARIYLAGHSQGGLGAYTSLLHKPDLFTASRPADGFTDINYDYQWLKTWFPPYPGGIYSDCNDGYLVDYFKTITAGEPDEAHPERLSVMNGSSARYILENAVNNHLRIVHGTPDANVPNSLEPVGIAWWTRWWFFWVQAPAPQPYTTATSTYANGKGISDLLSSWASTGRYSSEYITNPYFGHGFLDTYPETAASFETKVGNRRPLEVAYKTYDDHNDGAWWLRVSIPEPGANKPGMARVVADPAANSAAVHARNLSRLELDVGRMGLDSSAGKTMTFSVDDNTAPNVFPIDDPKGEFALELTGSWANPAGYVVKLDGAALPTSDYSVTPTSIVVDSVPAAGGHTLTVVSPATLPANLAPNPGVETEGTVGTPQGWAGVLSGSASASFAWDDSETHTGARSLRVKSPVLSGTDASALWKSDPVAVSQGSARTATAFAKARMSRMSYMGLGIAWYKSDGTFLGVNWSNNLRDGENATNREWTPLSVSAQAPAGCSYARLVAGASGLSTSSAPGSVWFDDFTLR